MAERTDPTTIDEYIAAFPARTQQLLADIRATIRSVAPEATERISYRIPTFDLQGPLVFFAGFENHVSLYPVPRENPEFREELAAFKGGKGTARFPLDGPLPIDLIRRIVEFRVRSNREAEEARRIRRRRAR